MTLEKTTEKIRAFWDSRAEYDHTSGSDDFILKDLETRAIFEMIESNSRILEIGCGNGQTLISLCKEKGCSGLGIDFSSKMISLAKKNAEKQGVSSLLEFNTGAVPDVKQLGQFDFALSQRCLGNLTSIEDQRGSVLSISSNLNIGGRYIMVEDCKQSHERLNEFRKAVGLDAIDAPWFNLFLDADIVPTWQSNNISLLSGPKQLASTYYLLSRVIYAKLAHDKGTKPEDLKYDSEINMLAYDMPNFGDLGAPSMWVWERVG